MPMQPKHDYCRAGSGDLPGPGAQDLGASPDLPVVLSVAEAVVTARCPGSRAPQEVPLHGRLGGWTLMALMERDGRPVAVFEEVAARYGRVAYIGPHGPLLVLPKTLEPTRVPEGTCYNSHTKAEVLGAGQDVLRAEVLAGDADPDYQTVSALFPPIRRARWGAHEAPHTFIGSSGCCDVVPVYYNCLEATPRLNPVVVAPEVREAMEQELLWEGLVGGWLPCVRVLYPVSQGQAWEMVQFGTPEAPNPNVQPVWYRLVKLDGDQLLEAHYFDSYLPYPWPAEPPASDFYSALWDLYNWWASELDGGMELDVPERWVADFCRHALVQERVTRTGDDPHYGVVDRMYGGHEHDGFQDVLNSAVSCYLEWGYFDIARRYLDNYLTKFVRPDGSIDYRGPEIGQYGRTLALLAQYHTYTGDSSLLLQHEHKVMAMTNVLLSRRAAACALPRDDPGYGLLPGRHEADISFITPSLATFDYERPYFSNSTEAWRGMRDLGLCWAKIGQQLGNPGLVRRGEGLQAEAAALARDVARAIERSWVWRDGTPTLPLFAGATMLHLDAPYRSRPEAFDEDRVWSEMLHSGLLGRETVEAVLSAAAAHGDSTLGILGNRKHVVAFMACGVAYGMVQHDLVRELLLLYYAHASHLHTRGTWTALECVDMDRDRADHLPYCAPAQLTVPTITKWMFAFEDPVDGTLWLGKALPRHWLEDGQCVGVKGAPTSRGPVSFHIRSLLSQGRVEATVALPPKPGPRAKLRLRLPRPHSIQSVNLNGVRWDRFDPASETIDLPPWPSSELKVVVRAAA